MTLESVDVKRETPATKT